MEIILNSKSKFILLQISLLLLIKPIRSISHRTISNKTEIHIAAFLPYPETVTGYLGLDQVESVKEALADINNKDYMLKHYRLKAIFYYTKFNAGTAVNDFIHMVAEKPIKYGIIGLLASSVSEVVCLTTKDWNLATISSSSVSVTMNNRDKFPYFYRTTLSDASYIEAQITFVKHFNWSNIAVVYDISSTYSPTASLLINRLRESNVTVGSSLGVLQIYDHAIENIKGKFSLPQRRCIYQVLSLPLKYYFCLALSKSKQIRVIITVMELSGLKKFLCKAYYSKIYGKKYIWIFPGYYPERWYHIADEDVASVNCTTEQLFEVVKYSFAIYRSFNRNENVTKTISGKTTWETYQHFHSIPRITRIHDHLKAYTYDAMWTLALALNATDTQLRENNRSLLEFTYRSSHIMRIINKKIKESSFQGLTGHVSYKKRERVEKVHILQLQGNITQGTMVTVGIYHFGIERVQFDTNYPNSHSITWPAGKPIKSPPLLVITKLTVSSTAIIIFDILAGVGILFGLGFLLFNIINRKNRNIRLSSPHLNTIFAIGCILCYLDVIVLSINTDHSEITVKNLNVLCGTQIWLLCYGFTLAFGSLFAKTWRVYRIFANKTSKIIAIKDWHLITTVANLLVVDIVIFIVWTSVDELQGTISTITTIDDPNDPDIRIQTDLHYCTCRYFPVWLGIVCGYKFLLLIFGSFLAFETRRVNMKVLNDSKFIGFSIYNVSVFCLLGVLSSIAVGNQETLNYCLRSGCIIVCTTVTMIMVFLPKVLVWKDAKSFIEPSSHIMTSSTTSGRYDIKREGNRFGRYLQLSDLSKLQTMLQQKYKTYHKLRQELATLQDVVNDLKHRYQCNHS
ncbi:Gamma-aminobutyric acid type B receptor subunit 2 [Trichoplax sp. H2]|nr:Gamma-aminobutyric acid type B receptor subunit 2 [Trichoplax sp. H2]|eukprot:RDD43844.1 Gamma-aminobutyric acid type B receptor subunit 2 [Trichoplax sp. H2]